MRLTNDVKDKIITAALRKAGIFEEFAQHAVKRAEWANKVRLANLGIKESLLLEAKENIKNILSTLPKKVINQSETFCTKRSMYICIGGSYFNADFNGNYINAPVVIGGHDVWLLTVNTTVILDVLSPLAMEYTNIEHERIDLEAKRNEIRTQVAAAMSQYNTVAQLLKAWPEAIELIPPALLPKKKQLPMIPVEDLNLLIGLPSEI